MVSSLDLLSQLTTEDLTECQSSTRTERIGGDDDDDDGGETKGNSRAHEVDDASAAAATAAAVGAVASVQYDRHKPKWWKQRVGRYVTKPQRRAMEAMHAYRLSKPPYGQVLDFDSIFSLGSRTEAAGAASNSTAATTSTIGPKAVWMELGFGKGDNLLCLAQRNPDALFVGVEVHPSSIAICLQRIQQSLEQKEPWGEYEWYRESNDPFYGDGDPVHKKNPTETAIELGDGTSTAGELPGDIDDDGLPSSSAEPHQNVRVYGGDGIVLLESGVAPCSLDVVLITFPDPFPSDKPHRIVQVHTVNTFVRCLKATGRLLLATDHQGFYDWAHEVVNEWNVGQQQKQQKQKQQQHEPPRPRLAPIVNLDRREWLPVVSRYERKGWEEGRRTLLAGWEKETTGFN